jgi:hypothetical protein
MFPPLCPGKTYGSTPSMEEAMQYTKMLLQRFGLFAPKSEAVDPFQQRLQRIGQREKRLSQRKALFRPTLQPAEV